MSITPPTIHDKAELHRLATTLKLHGLLAHWEELSENQCSWVNTWMQWDEFERVRRTLERRMSNAHIGTFKPLTDFDWQ